MDSIFPALIVMWLVVLYVLPTAVALQRRHRNFAPITIINLFLGWTLVGWVVALAWAYSDDQRGRNGQPTR